MRLAAVAGLCVLVAGGAASATSPRTGVTKSEAIQAFVDAANLACIFSTVSRRPLESASQADEDLVQPDADDQRASLAKGRPFWVSRAMGNHLQVFTDKDGVCNVVANQLPVQATLDAEARTLRDLGGAAYQERPFKPGYNPIGYEFVRTVDGDLVTIHMEGADPGAGFDHVARFSLMWVRVSRKAPGR